MIGRVEFTHDGTEHTATLAEDGSWSVAPPLPDGVADAVSDRLQSISADYGGPQSGPFGPGQVRAACLSLNGTSVLDAKETMPPGTVY